MKIYPEFLEPAVRDDLLANHSFYEAGQFAYLLESFAEHYLRQRPVDLLEATLDPAFARELLASSVDPHLLAGKVATRLGTRLGRRLKLYVLDRPGLGLGMEEIGLGPGDWRNVSEAPVEGDLVVHFLDNERIVYSRPFEGDIAFAAGKSVRSRFLGRTLLQRYGELFVLYQDIAPAEVLHALNEMELRIVTGADQRLFLELDPGGRREPLRLGERCALCQLGPDHRLSLIVSPRGQDPEPPRLESIWVAVGAEGMVEVQAVVRDAFELRGGRIQAQLSPRQSDSEPVGVVLELLGRRDGGLQIFRGLAEPADLLEPGEPVDVRLGATNRGGFRLEASGSGLASVPIRALLEPQLLAPPAFLSPAALARGFSLAFALPGEASAGKRFTLHCRQDRDQFQIGPCVCAQERVSFAVPPMEADEDASPLAFWLTCEDPGVPLASNGNGPETPLLDLPVYPIAPGGRPVTGAENFLFSDEALIFGSERLRLVRWSPPRHVRYPAPENYPFFLWRSRERPALRFLIRDGTLLTEASTPLTRISVGAGIGPAAEPSGANEVRVATQSSGRKAYLYLTAGDAGTLEVRKAAGRIHDVALDFEPLGASAPLPKGGSLLVAGTALFGLRYGAGSLEISLLGHWLMDEDLGAGVLVTSSLQETLGRSSWIHVAAERPLALTLALE